jgi:hypothetical protein
VGRLPLTLRAEPSGTWPSRLVTVLTRADTAPDRVDGGAPAGAAGALGVVAAAAPRLTGLVAAMPQTSQ